MHRAEICNYHGLGLSTSLGGEEHWLYRKGSGCQCSRNTAQPVAGLEVRCLSSNGHHSFDMRDLNFNGTQTRLAALCPICGGKPQGKPTLSVSNYDTVLHNGAKKSEELPCRCCVPCCRLTKASAALAERGNLLASMHWSLPRPTSKAEQQMSRHLEVRGTLGNAH